MFPNTEAHTIENGQGNMMRAPWNPPDSQGYKEPSLACHLGRGAAQSNGSLKAQTEAPPPALYLGDS